MNLLTLLFSGVLGLGIGGPAAKLVFLEQNASFQSPVDMHDWNVMYDLATLYGDKNNDGVLNQDEYNKFVDIGYKELIPNSYNNAKDEGGNVLVDDSFSFLGILPVSNNQVYTYVYTKEQISSTYIDGGYFKYSSKDWEYGLSYFNSPELVDGQYVNTIPKTSTMKFINELGLGKDGYFSKFIIEDNQIIKQSDEVKTSDGFYLMRIKPERFIASFKNNTKLIDKKIETYELSFDSNYWNNENRMKNTLFNEKTIEVTDAAIDGFLCSNDAEKEGEGWNFLFNTISGTQETVTNSAYEFYYYFFNMEGFDPDNILSITYSYVPITWQHIYYNTEKQNRYGAISIRVMDSAKKGITAYTREEAKKYVNEMSKDPYYIKNEGKKDEEKFYLGYSESVGSRITRTVNYDDNFTVEVNVPSWWKATKHHRKVNVKSIVNMKNIDSELGEQKELVSKNSKKTYDVNVLLRSFLKGETSEEVDALYDDVDHNKYNWAFLIHEDDWIRTAKYRKIDELPFFVTIIARILTKGVYTYVENTSEIVSTCHEPDGVLVTYMKVAKDDKEYNLNVISNPLSVRKNYIVGYHAPGLLEIIIKAINSFFKDNGGWLFWLIVILVSLLVLGILGIIFKPVKAVLKYVLKGIVYVGELIINTAYLILIWWWLAIIKKAREEELPPTWLFNRSKK